MKRRTNNLGRPAIHGVRKMPLTVRLTPEIRWYLKQIPKRSAAEEVEAAIRGTSAFRRWKRERE